MTSTVTLYLKCLVEKDKNFILDSVDDDETGTPEIETYLATLSSTVISNFQYVKHGLSISIKIDKSQTALNMGDGSSDLNYCKIQNGTENPCYYFIVSKTWKSQNTVELVLNMDTLNTFYYNVDYKISKKTFIKRMHKDRFESLYSSGYSFTFHGLAYIHYKTSVAINKYTPTNIQVSAPAGVSCSASVVTVNGIRYISVACVSLSIGNYEISVSYDLEAKVGIIDLKSEEIIAPVYKKYEHTLYEQKGTFYMDWALYYRTADDQVGTPIDCYLVPSEPMTIKVQQNAGEINTGNVPSGKYLIFSSTYTNGELTFDYGDGTVTITNNGGSGTSVLPPYNQVLISVFNDSGVLKTYRGQWYGGQYPTLAWTQIHVGTLNILNAPATVYAYESASQPNTSAWSSGGLWRSSNATYTIAMGSLVDTILLGKDSIDKTLSTNIKIINLPYSPTNFSVSSNIYTYKDCWSYIIAEGMTKLVDFNTRFINNVETDEESILTPLYSSFDAQYWDENTQQRTFIDPKLYHSDFYRPKFVYDSFAKIFPLEQMSIGESADEPMFKFQFVMSRNIVSKFLFKFDQFKYVNSKEDYDNVLAVSRNNEEVLYNSQYLDYIRTGYNYDLKAKERTEVASGIGIGLNVASLVGSLAIGIATQNPLGYAAAFASGVGLVSQLVNYSKNVAQNEENIQKKLQESQMQAVSVLNADDSDLLWAYSENKAKLCIYEVSTDMQRVLSDLFHYCGYTINKQGMPDVYSRRSFNFLQATLVIDETNNLTNEIVEDIKEKFENGVTFLHLNFNNFDFAQDKENIEMSLF